MFQLIEDATGDPNNARAMCAACQIAYMPEADGVAKFRELFGMTAKLISVDNTQAYVASNDDHILLLSAALSPRQIWMVSRIGC